MASRYKLIGRAFTARYGAVGSQRAKMKRVVVVGGGVAGIAAAKKLVSSECFDVKLLEAKDRLGGRCHSIRLSGVGVDVGASFFHGAKGNVLFEMAQACGFALSEPQNVLSLLSDGTSVPKEVLDRYYLLFEGIVGKLQEEQWRESDRELDDYLTTEFFREARGVQEMNGGVSTHRVEEDPYVHPAFHWLLTNAGVDGGTRFCQGAGVGTRIDFDYLEGPHDNELVDGHCYGDLIQELAKGIPEDTVNYGTEVYSIEWNICSSSDSGEEHQKHPIIVHTSKGDYFADHVIVTVSLGVLKAVTQSSTSAFFTPPLPKEKLEAITAIGYGLLNKVIMEFEEPIADSRWVCFLWKPEDLQNDPLVKKHPWLASLHYMRSSPNSSVYTVAFAGEDAQQVASLPEEEVVRALLKTVEERFLRKSLPPLKRVIRSNWGEDPCFLGTYSFSTPVTRNRHREALAQPLTGCTPLQVLFAGEATHPTFFSTTHGAFESGVCEAERLIQYYEK